MTDERNAAEELLQAYREERQPQRSRDQAPKSHTRNTLAKKHEEVKEEPLIALRSRLREVQAELEALQKLIVRLEDARRGHAGPSTRESLYAAFPSKPVSTASGNMGKQSETRPAAFFPAKIRSEGVVTIPAFRQQSKSSANAADGQQFPNYAAALEELQRRKGLLSAEMARIRNQVLVEASQAVQERLGVKAPLTASGARKAGALSEDTMNERGEILNEEGLPFFEPVEILPEERPSPGSRQPIKSGKTIAPFTPKRQDKGARKAWMDSIFSSLEAEDEEYLARVGEWEDEVQDNGQGEDKVDFETRDASSDDEMDEDEVDIGGFGSQAAMETSTGSLPSSSSRPPPPKPALKKTGYTPPRQTTPSFGAAGLKRGFLNLNPSSPAAEHASDYVDRGYAAAATANEREKEKGKQKAGADATDSPGKPKKHVRIRSPTRERGDDAEESSRGASTSSRGNLEDEDVEDEARRIVDLLGPGVVDMQLPGMPGTSDPVPPYPLRRQRPVATPSTSGATAAPPAKAAISRSVFERNVAPAQGADANIQKAKAAAFQRGFLSRPNRNPVAGPSSTAASTSKAKVDPRTSLGMSALDRAVKADEPLEKRREAQGLTPAIPHARPSKAFAEKMRQRQEAGEKGRSEDEQDQPEGSKPEGSSSVRFGSVLVGEAATGSPGLGRNARFADQGNEIEEEHEEGTDAMDYDELSEEDPEEAAHLAFDTDDEDSYNSDDLADLEPDFDDESFDFDIDHDMHMAEIQRQYALAKASLMQNKDVHRQALESGRSPGVIPGEELVPMDTIEDDEGVHVSSTGKAKVSRFKQDRMARAFGTFTQAESRRQHRELQQAQAAAERNPEERADEAGHDLVHLLQDAQNVGPEGRLPDGADMDMQPGAPSATGSAGRPVMVIPQIAPVRFTPGGRAILEGAQASKDGIELEGESDGDDDRLMEIVKQRLSLAEKEDDEGTSIRPEARPKKEPIFMGLKERQPHPNVEGVDGHSRDVGGGAAASAAEAPQGLDENAPPKKVSRFKAARMAQQGY